MIFHVIKRLSLTNVHVDCWPVVMLTDWSWHLASYSRLQHPQPNVKLDLQLMEGAWSWDVMSELSHSRRSRMGWGVIALIERGTTLEQWRWGQHGTGPSTSTVSLLLLTQVMSACRHVKKASAVHFTNRCRIVHLTGKPMSTTIPMSGGDNFCVNKKYDI